ncbi:MAG TPA: stage II sporulation protein M [Aggregatilinea sp.]|uniref:stage II sporulation protein M n=1 Tax=Aggregatilinea sp. TaxID=2806333 RepID=UPI002B6A22D1|nr:stage II sporulation protein M [Aggregatilinea sp.]HML22156.1 stage II sporulation protein M [Aggregatilinea sp.]
MLKATDPAKFDAVGGLAVPSTIPQDERTPVTRTLSNALIVTRREVRDSFRDWRIVTPIFLLTLVFPLLANVMTNAFVGFFVEHGADPLLPSLLPLMPMIVGFFPVSISLVIALETFVGEKERLSLEPLLSTPLTNTELYLGKAFAAMLPPLLASYTGVIVYISGLMLGSQQWRPPAILIVQILVLTTVQALVMVTGAVVVSSQTTSTRAANLLASFIVIPVSLLVMGESVIMVQPYRRFLLWYVSLGLLVVVVLLVRMGARIFNREELLGRSLDQINIRHGFQVLWSQIKGVEGRFSLPKWYRQSIFPAIGSLKDSAAVVAVCIVAALVLGAIMGAHWRLPLDQAQTDEQSMAENMQRFFDLGQGSPHLILAVVMQNVRVLALGTLLAMISFGVAPLVLVMLPFGIIGYLAVQIAGSGIDPIIVLAGVAPHGLFEIPAILLSGAAALRLGSILTKPPRGMVASEVWLRALGDALKLGVGVVLPLLIVAGVMEVLVTPHVIELVLK